MLFILSYAGSLCVLCISPIRDQNATWATNFNADVEMAGWNRR